ncbi:hypothetical protein DUNSADRAFT_9160 [Dunaliella salina]|uniref:SET domain-containing protein n=1 Tax=Dunaliella salina TaxID=3046 RepID=A0ABQ7GI79_DUNSA|nr:hypothetical protein DUNSADRAFT_9160 [Dunaliella salina]|eukprot:KAF5834248.1 hypothetical protein DUNSADRAFT_9160 [Dunaliella salina]
MLSSHLSHRQLALSKRPTLWARQRGAKVRKPTQCAHASLTNQDALYTSNASLSAFVCERLSLELTEHGGLGFKANAKISSGDLLLTTPPIEAVWAEVRMVHDHTEVADQKLGAFCGVWPVFSIFNHSCAPNTVFFSVCSSTSPERFSSHSHSSSSSSSNNVAGDNMGRNISSWRLSQEEPHLVMHAARDIEPGEAVTVTYMGPQLLQPVDVRREHLQASYGFECRCPRCSFEAQVHPETRQAMVALAENAQVAQEAIGEALGPELCGDQELLETAQAALNHVRREFATLSRESGLSSAQREQTDSTSNISSPSRNDGDAPRQKAEQLAQLLWIQASYYPLHSPTVADRTELADVQKAIEAWGKEDEAEGPLPADMAIFQGAQRIIQEVAPGSDLHVALAVQSKFCAERLLGALGIRATPMPKSSGTENQEEDGVSEVAIWLQDSLLNADNAAQRAIRSRYGHVSDEYAERLFWLNAAERLPKPLLELCWAYRERRLSAMVD